MSEIESKRSRIKAKIAASQARLNGDGPVTPPVRRTLPDAHPPQDYRSLAAEYPVLTVAAGLALGLAAGALLPKRIGGKLGQRTLGAVTMMAELGLALGKQARDTASDAAHAGTTGFSGKLDELGRLLDTGTAMYRARARQSAGQAASSVRGAGRRAARAVLQLADHKPS